MLLASPPLVVDTLPEEVYAAAHIPGARNACIYEMAFLSHMDALAPDKDQTIVVCGAGQGSLDAQVALSKLHAAGYWDAKLLDGGLPAWQEAGFPTEGDGRSLEPALDGSRVVNAAESVIRWTGRNLFNHHSGSLKLASGEIVFASGELQSARLEIDMRSITCEDLPDPDWNALLLQHLASEDFFDAGNHPTAVFAAAQASKIPGVSDGRPNYMLAGNLTLRGVTQELEFPMLVALNDQGRLTAQGSLEVDRTDYGSQYGSGKFFRFLGKHLVNDHFQLHLKIHADLS